MDCRFSIYVSGSICVGLLLAGCESQEPVPDLVSPATSVAMGTPPVAETIPTPLESAAAPLPEDQLESAAEDSFSPPFPHRVELFVPPGRSVAAARRNDTANESVEVKGFVSPRGGTRQHVLLAFGGVETPVAEGQEKYGVRVVSIQWPSVTLQRGRSRWVETLD